jgi:uncharacterized pyridoxamine 5'-phosphate oxidase family protein
MEVHELTEEERDEMVEKYLKMLKVERKHLSKEDLEKEIVDYLSKKHPCSLATCGKDCEPRISVVDYMNDGIVIYIISEGGEKFKNIKENNKVAIGIGTSARTTLSVRGLNLWGIADVFTEETEEFVHGMELFSPILKSMQETAGGGKPLEIPKGLLRMIRVTPTKMVYNHNIKGIKNAHWKA